MRKNRDLFRQELASRFNIISGRVGVNAYLVDLEYGIPEGASQSEIINICLSYVKSSDWFLCILGERYGRPIAFSALEEPVMETVRRYGRQISRHSVSVTELETLTALDSMPCVFFRQVLEKRDPETENLIDFLKSRHCQIYDFRSYDDFMEIALNAFRERMSVNESGTQFDSAVSRNQLFARRMRYFCNASSARAKIDEYVNGDSDRILLLTGESGAGKTTALAEWIQDNERKNEFTIISWFKDLGPANFTGMLTYLLEQTHSNPSSLTFSEDALHLFHKELSMERKKKTVVLIDGIDALSDDEDPLGWMLSELKPWVKMICSATNLTPVIRKSDKVEIFTVKSVPKETLIREIYRLEGKRYQFEAVSLCLMRVCAGWSSRQIILGIQQLLREARYVSPGAVQTETPWNAERISRYLLEFHSESDIFQRQLQYLLHSEIADSLSESLQLLACSEKGLSIQELSEITGKDARAVYQFYFTLEVNEEMYSLPLDIRNYVLSGMSSNARHKIRWILADYFSKVFSDRAVIELYYQLLKLRDYDSLPDLLASPYRAKIIYANTTLYHNEQEPLTRTQWKQIKRAWMMEFQRNPDLWSEQEIYYAHTYAREQGDLEASVSFLLLLTYGRGKTDDFSLASYYQHLAGVYDELDNPRAIPAIEKALHYLNRANSSAYPQSRSDTLQLAAAIYSHFLPLQPDLREKESLIREKIHGFLEEAVAITDTRWSANAYLRAIAYHNAAYSLMNIEEYQEAYRYITRAMECGTTHLPTLTHGFYLSSQICLFLYREDIDQQCWLDRAETAIEKSYALITNCSGIFGEADKNEFLSHIFNHWADVLCERGDFSKALSIIRKAVKIDESGLSNDIYRTYYNAGIYCLNSCLYGDIDCYEEGMRYAESALRDAKERNTSQSSYDIADIHMLFSRLARTRKRLFKSHYHLCRAILGYRKNQADIFPIDIQENFQVQAGIDRLLFKIENALFHCFQ